MHFIKTKCFQLQCVWIKIYNKYLDLISYPLWILFKFLVESTLKLVSDPLVFEDIGGLPSRNKVVRQDSYLAACKKPVVATALKGINELCPLSVSIYLLSFKPEFHHFYSNYFFDSLESLLLKLLCKLIPWTGWRPEKFW